MLLRFCQERGWEVHAVYSDDGYSGVDRTRPAFNRLLLDCENGKIDIVLCKDQSRFSRDTVIIEQYLNDRFLEWGIRFIGVADNADTDSESYGTMRLFTSAYNEMYVKDISAKIRRTLASKREQGQFVGSFAPYGYRIDPDDRHHLIIDLETAPVVRQIFAMYIEGSGYRKIVQTLNVQGIVSPSAYKRQNGSRYVNGNADACGLWTQSTIAAILSNETYTGTLVQGRSHHISYKNKKRRKVPRDDWVRIPGAHEPVIDADTWARTQARRSSHARAGTSSQELSPLSGKVKCAVCGRPMKRNVYYNKSRTIRYYGLQCASYKTGAMNCPNHKTISGQLLERKILEALNAVVEQYCQPEKIRLDDPHREQLAALEKQFASLETRRDAAQNRLVAMYKDKLDGAITDAEYALFRESLQAEEQTLARQTEALHKQITACRTQQEQTADRNTLLRQYLPFRRLDRSIADAFVDTVEIGEVDETGEREVVIRWKF
jgi:DNA invertase Pin-like site-specific DNA recombinase